eukprot:365340-Chlamydomonas_euryale.AAC.3
MHVADVAKRHVVEAHARAGLEGQPRHVAVHEAVDRVVHTRLDKAVAGVVVARPLHRLVWPKCRLDVVLREERLRLVNGRKEQSHLRIQLDRLASLVDLSVAAGDDDGACEASPRVQRFVCVAVVHPHHRRGVAGAGAGVLRHRPDVLVRPIRRDRVVGLVGAPRAVHVRRALRRLVVQHAVRVHARRVVGQVVAEHDVDGVADTAAQHWAEQAQIRVLRRARFERREVAVGVLAEHGLLPHAANAWVLGRPEELRRDAALLDRRHAAVQTACGAAERQVVPLHLVGGDVVVDVPSARHRRRCVALDAVQCCHARREVRIHVAVEHPAAGVVRVHVGDDGAGGDLRHLVRVVAVVLEHVPVPVRIVHAVLRAKAADVPADLLARAAVEAGQRAERVAVHRVAVGVPAVVGKVLRVVHDELGLDLVEDLHPR